MKPVFFDTQSGRRAALVHQVGRKWTYLIVMDSSGLTRTKIPTETPLKEIPAGQCNDPIGKFRESAKQFGCTKTVAQALGLKNAIPRPRTEETPDDSSGATADKKSPVRKGTGAPGKARAGRKSQPKGDTKPNTAAAEKSTEKAVARGDSKAAFIQVWNRFAAGKLKFDKVPAECDKTWQIGEARAKKRVARMMRETKQHADKPTTIEAA